MCIEFYYIIYKCIEFVIITFISQTLESYLNEKGGANIIDNYKQNSGLSDVNRRLLVTLAVNFLRSIYGNHPQKLQKISCAKAIVELFPYLKNPIFKIGGIVSIII